MTLVFDRLTKVGGVLMSTRSAERCGELLTARFRLCLWPCLYESSHRPPPTTPCSHNGPIPGWLLARHLGNDVMGGVGCTQSEKVQPFQNKPLS